MKSLLKKIGRFFELPKTKTLYGALGVPEPEAWKWVVLSTLPLGVFLLPSFLFDNFENIQVLAIYTNFLNSVIGSMFIIGSSLILYSWWGGGSQSARILREIRGHIFLAGAFLTIALLGLPYFYYNIFTFLVSLGLGVGAGVRAGKLIQNHYKTQRGA